MSRYRQTMAEAYKQVMLSESTITKLKNGVKVLGNPLPNKALAQKMADKANREMGHNADVYQSPFNNRFYVRIKEDIKEADDHEISMARGELEAIADKALKLSSILQGKSDEDNIEAWVQSKITKAKDYINSVADYMEYNPDVANEELEESFSDAHIALLKKEYEPLRGKRISVDNANKLGALFTKFDKDKNALEKLYGGDIPFVSTMAMTRLMTKHNYKAADLNKLRKEETMLLDVLEEAGVLEEGTGTIKGFRNDKEKSNMVSLAKQHSLKVKDVPGGIELSGNMRKILDMQLAAQGNGLKAEEVELEEAEDYGLRGRITDTQLANLKKVWAKKTQKDVTPGIMKMLKDMDSPTRAAVANAGINVISKLVPEAVEKKEKTPAIEPDVRSDGEKNVKKEDDSEKLKSELEKKDNEIAMLKQKAIEDKAKAVKKDTEKLVNPETGEPLLQVGIAYKHLKDKMKNKEEVKEDLNKDDEKAIKPIIKQLKKSVDMHGKQAKDLEKAMTNEMAKDKAYAIGMAQAKKKFNDEPPLDKKTIRKGHEIADKLMSKKEENVEEGRMSQIDQMRKDGASAADIAKELKLPVKIVKDILGEDKQEHPAKALYESLEALKKKAEKTGMPYSILKQVYDRGMAAWKGGHRPGAGQHQWALARVNSFVTKSSGTWGGADKDLAAKVKGSK